jgi:hypothetical protein
MKKTAEVFVVERSFEQAPDLEQLQEMERRAAWCLSTHRVTFLRTFFSADRKRMICMYTAPDAEAVRVVQRQSGLPYDRVWEAGVYEASPPEGE